MTERLTQLLLDEAQHLDIPPVPAAEALARGRRTRRRRTATIAGATVAVLAVAGGVGLVAIDGDDTQDRAADPADASQVADVPVFGDRSTVYLGDLTATVPDTIHSFHYTSAGVLVRSNPNDGASDGSGPESLTLVKYDGATVDLGTIPEGVGPATDPDEPVYALAEARGDGFAAVVRDATTGDAVAEVPLPQLPPSYSPVPPLALDGDTLYAGFESETVAVDLTTGDSHVVSGMGGGIPTVLGGRTVTGSDTSVNVLDAATGEELLSVDTKNYGYGTLSADGSYLSVSEMDEKTFENVTTVYDVDSGEPVNLGQLNGAQDLGWTAAGQPFAVENGTLTSCDLDAGSCASTAVPIKPDSFVHLGGRVYES